MPCFLLLGFTSCVSWLVAIWFVADTEIRIFCSLLVLRYVLREQVWSCRLKWMMMRRCLASHSYWWWCMMILPFFPFFGGYKSILCIAALHLCYAYILGSIRYMERYWSDSWCNAYTRDQEVRWSVVLFPITQLGERSKKLVVEKL